MGNSRGVGGRAEAGREEEKESTCRARLAEQDVGSVMHHAASRFFCTLFIPFYPHTRPHFLPPIGNHSGVRFSRLKRASFCMLLFLMCVDDIVFLSLVSFIFTKNHTFKVRPCCSVSMAWVCTNYRYDTLLCHQLPSFHHRKCHTCHQSHRFHTCKSVPLG